MRLKTTFFLFLISLGEIFIFAQSQMYIPYLKNEKWYGGATNLGPKMPFESDREEFDLRTQDFNNQTSPLLISSCGRYLWADGPIRFSFNDSCLNVESHRGNLTLSQAADPTLRGAYNEVSSIYFPPEGAIPPEEFFNKPIYNTWIELMYDQNQEDVLQYAKAIVDNGFPIGVLMIDDNWQKDYGDWEFRPDRFPAPKEMVDTLHSMGFKVMLWVCPFISPDSKEARDLNQKGYLLKKPGSNEMAVVNWWNGYSACYDLSNPEAYDYLKNKFHNLQDKYGIDGFKFDAGDQERYLSEDVEVFDGQSYDTEQTRLWAQLASEFPYNELRACWKMGNQPLVQRLGDKQYSWKGVSELVPAMISAALLGHSYACPDMIGGGAYGSFLNIKEDEFNADLIIRSCQIHSLMPMMQFSVAPWRILKKDDLSIIKKYADLHCSFGPYILEMAEKTASEGTPIVRHMAYSFPNEGFEEINDQYMLGDLYLVAPVSTASATRNVKLPKGEWLDDTGKKIKGGKTITLENVPIDRLPYYKRIK